MNNYFKDWYKVHRGYKIRNYADRILNHELPQAFTGSNVAVLAAAPNSGKTIMAISWMEKYLHDNPSHRVLVLAHNQRQLRDQFHEEIIESSVDFTFEKVESADRFLASQKQVVVTIPRTIIGGLNQNNLHFDLLVVDEAHHYYHAEDGMLTKIINRYNFDKQLLLTGTPAPFIAEKKKIIPVSLDELVDGGHCSDPIVIIAKTPSKITAKNFNSHQELKKTIVIDSQETRDALDNLLPIVEAQISETGWKNSTRKLRKTLIVCRRIDQANTISEYFKNLGIKNLLSTSDSDQDSKNINRFITTKIEILIVVDRAVLGFNFPSLVSIIDMKYGKNINNLFQLFNRITRIHPDEKIQKYFFKVVPVLLEAEYTYMLTAALSLMLEENYVKYNGFTIENFKVRARVNYQKHKSFTKNGISTIFKNQPINYLGGIPVFKMWKEQSSDYIWSTLGDAKHIIPRKTRRYWKRFDLEENYQFCLETVRAYLNTKTAA